MPDRSENGTAHSKRRRWRGASCLVAGGLAYRAWPDVALGQSAGRPAASVLIISVGVNSIASGIVGAGAGRDIRKASLPGALQRLSNDREGGLNHRPQGFIFRRIVGKYHENIERVVSVLILFDFDLFNTRPSGKRESSWRQHLLQLFVPQIVRLLWHDVPALIIAKFN